MKRAVSGAHAIRTVFLYWNRQHALFFDYHESNRFKNGNAVYAFVGDKKGSPCGIQTKLVGVEDVRYIVPTPSRDIQRVVMTVVVFQEEQLKPMRVSGF